jgi:Ca-activated chloride channel family protein
MRNPFLVLLVVLSAAASMGAESQEGFRFRSGVELINVTATVTDTNGRFVSGLHKEDFAVYDDGERQEVTHFSNERVPVSLGIALDASGSMTDDKMDAARAAIDRFVFDLLTPDDELFFVEFSTNASLTQPWTSDPDRISRAVRAVRPAGGTAMYDAIATALPEAQAGKNQKKALLVISDGNDTNSTVRVGELRQLIRESEVLVYALGVDGAARSRAPVVRPPTIQLPIPFPFPGGRGRTRIPPPVTTGGSWPSSGGERVNADALRQITDDTGGRTEIVRDFSDLDRATARIADELSKQYFLGYPRAGEKDGRWHSIRVEVKDRRHTVRARRGYVAS